MGSDPISAPQEYWAYLNTHRQDTHTHKINLYKTNSMIFIVSGTQTSTYDSLIISYLPVYIPSKFNMTKISILFRGAGDKTLDLAHIKQVKYHLSCVFQNHIFYHPCVLWVDSRLTPCRHSSRQCHSLFICIAETAVILSAVTAVTQPTVCVSTVYSI